MSEPASNSLGGSQVAMQKRGISASKFKALCRDYEESRLLLLKVYQARIASHSDLRFELTGGQLLARFAKDRFGVESVSGMRLRPLETS